MAINKLYWITHVPMGFLLGLCDLSLSVMCAPPIPTLIDTCFVFFSAMATSIIYTEIVAPIIEQHDPRLSNDFLWGE